MKGSRKCSPREDIRMSVGAINNFAAPSTAVNADNHFGRNFAQAAGADRGCYGRMRGSFILDKRLNLDPSRAISEIRWRFAAGDSLCALTFAKLDGRFRQKSGVNRTRRLC
jgi:hypothetical protein